MNQLAKMDGDRLAKRVQNILSLRETGHARVETDFHTRIKAALDEATPPADEVSAPDTSVAAAVIEDRDAAAKATA